MYSSLLLLVQPSRGRGKLLEDRDGCHACDTLCFLRSPWFLLRGCGALSFWYHPRAWGLGMTSLLDNGFRDCRSLGSV